MIANPTFVLRVDGGRSFRLSVGLSLSASDLPALAPLDAADPAVLRVTANPADRTTLGLTNRSTVAWTAEAIGRPPVAVPSGRTLKLLQGTRIRWGSVTATVEAESVTVPGAALTIIEAFTQALCRGPTGGAFFVGGGRDHGIVSLKDTGELIVALAVGPPGGPSHTDRVAAIFVELPPDLLIGIAKCPAYLVRVADRATPLEVVALQIDVSEDEVEVHERAVPDSGDEREAYQRVLDCLAQAGQLLEVQTPASTGSIERMQAEGRSAVVAEGNFQASIGASTATPSIIFITTCVFAAQWYWRLDESTHGLVVAGAQVGELTVDQPWRLLTSAYLHVNLIHFFCNMSSLHEWGRVLEAAIGSSRFFLLYTVTAIVSSAPDVILNPEQVGVGASGAVCGVMGAILGLKVIGSQRLPPLSKQRLAIAGPITLTMLIGLALPMVNNLVHGVGVAAGFLLAVFGLLTVGLPRLSQERLKETGELAATCCVLTLACFGLQFNAQRPWSLVEPPARVTRAPPDLHLAAEFPVLLSVGSLTRDGDSIAWKLGRPKYDPFEIWIGQSKLPLGDTDAATAVGQLKSQLAEEGVGEGQTRSAVQAVARGPGRAAYVETKYPNGARILEWNFGLNGLQTYVHVVLGPGLPQLWELEAKRTVNSLRWAP